MTIKGLDVGEIDEVSNPALDDVNGDCLPVGEVPSGAAFEVSVDEQERFAGFCKALGHPARVRIVELLSHVDACICGNIVERLPLAQSTVSQHLKVLKDAGLIKGEIDGPRTCYCLDREAISEFKGLCNALL